MNIDFVVCIIAVLALIATLLSFVPAFCEVDDGPHIEAVG